ncbi:hypothetical protein V6N13_040001 [Hibiscus sabdariffa]
MDCNIAKSCMVGDELMALFSSGIVPSLVFKPMEKPLVGTLGTENPKDGRFGTERVAWICFEEESRKVEAMGEVLSFKMCGVCE